MKRIGLIIAIATFLVLITSSASATSWLTYRDTVTVSSGTVDLNFESLNVTGTSTHVNFSLPCELSSLDQTQTVFRVNATTNITYNLTVNGVAVKANHALVGGTIENTTLADCITAGVSGTDTYMDVTFTSNATATVKGEVYANDAPLTSTWLSNNVITKERDITTPTVGTGSTTSFWTVNDSIEIDNFLGYTLTDLKANITYPSDKISTPITQRTVASLANNTRDVSFIQYQKYAPYVYKVIDSSSGTSHQVTVYIRTHELLTQIVDWQLIPSKDVYKGYFDTLDNSTLKITYNGVSQDYTVDSNGYVNINDFTTRESWSQNKFVFTWTEAQAVVPPAQVSWYEQQMFGLPVWVILSAVIVFIAIAVFYTKH